MSKLQLIMKLILHTTGAYQLPTQDKMGLLLRRLSFDTFLDVSLPQIVGPC
jgi:hypothetical protein